MTTATSGRWNVRSEMHNREDVSVGEGSDPTKQWVALFGEPTRSSPPSRYGKTSRLNSQLPDAYVGENLFLERHIEGLINAMGNVFTQELYPMVASDHVGKFELTTWEFNRGVLHETPWEGVPHLFTTRKSSRWATVSRRMGSLKFEGAHLQTDEGREEYDLKFQGMASVTIETLSLQTLDEMFNAIRRYRAEMMSLKSNRLSLKRRIKDEIEQFAVMNLSPSGFNKVVTSAIQTMTKRQVAGPFYLLVPPGTINNLSLERFPDATQRLDSDYMVNPERGGEGEAERSAPMGRITLGNGVTVIEVPDAMVETATIPGSPLSRNIFLGGAAMMALPKYMFNTGMYDVPYFSLSRAIKMWNSSGGYDVVTVRDALENASFPNMEAVVETIEEGPRVDGREGRESWEKRDFDPMLDSSNNRAIYRDHRNKRRAHMMICWDDYHSALPVHFWSMMDGNVLPMDMVQRMGECLARRSGVSPTDFTEAIEFFDRLKRAPGDHYFYGSLARDNAAYGMETTDQGAPDVVAYKEILSISEWKPQEYGGLVLPDMSGSRKDNFIPPSMACYPGLRAIMRYASEVRGYAPGLQETAQRVETTLDRLAAALTQALDGLPGDVRTRPEWFHVPDVKTCIVDTLITGPMDPLFMYRQSSNASAYSVSDAKNIPSGGPGTGIGGFSKTKSTQPPLVRLENKLSGFSQKNLSEIFIVIDSMTGSAKSNTKRAYDDFIATLANEGTSIEHINRLINGLAKEMNAQSDKAEYLSKTLLKLVGGTKRKTNTATARKEATRLIALADSESEGEGGSPGATTTDTLSYHRAPIVLTSGTLPYLRTTKASLGGQHWVLASDPRNGHLSTLRVDTLANSDSETFKVLTMRPSYRDPKTHMIGDHSYFSTHLESHLFGKNADGEGEHISASQGASFQSQFTDSLAFGMGDDDYQEEGRGAHRRHETDAALAAMAEASQGIGTHYSEEARESWKTHAGHEGSGGEEVALPYGAFLPMPDGSGPPTGVFKALLPITSDERPETFGQVAANLSISNVARKLYETRRIPSPFIRAMSIAVLFSRCDRQEDWLRLEDNDIVSPCSVTIVRPAFEVVMGSMVFMKPGPETGVNIFGNLMTWVGGHTATQTILVTMSLTAGTMTRRDKNLMPLSNVLCQGIISGGGDRWITHLDQIRDEEIHARADILPIINPATECNLPDYFSILGYYNNVLDDYITESGLEEQYPQYSSVQYLINRLKPSDSSEATYTLEDLYSVDRDEGEDALVYDKTALPPIICKDEWITATGAVHASRSHRKTTMQGDGASSVWEGTEAMFHVSGYHKDLTPIIPMGVSVFS